MRPITHIHMHVASILSGYSFALFCTFTQCLNQTQLASDSIWSAPHDKPQWPSQRASHFGVSCFWPRCSCSGLGARALDHFWCRSPCFGVTFGAEPVLWGYFRSRRPCFVGSLFVQAPVLCGVLFLVPVPVCTDLLIVVVMSHKTQRLDQAFGRHAFSPKACALDLQILVSFCHRGLIIRIK